MIRNVIERFALPYDNIYLMDISSLIQNYEQIFIKRFVNANELIENSNNEKINLFNEKLLSITTTVTFLTAFFQVKKLFIYFLFNYY